MPGSTMANQATGFRLLALIKRARKGENSGNGFFYQTMRLTAIQLQNDVLMMVTCVTALMKMSSHFIFSF